MNVLFVCSRNEWRSRTAETIFKNDNQFQVRSAGTSKTARIYINQGLINWADLIFVMEDHHKKRLKELFRKAIQQKEIIVLDIPDEYKYMDEELIKELQDTVYYYLNIL